MKRANLILLTLFIFVIGVGCASAADLNDYSIADDSVIIGHLGDGNINVVKNNELNTKRPDLSSARPDLVARLDVSSARPDLVARPDVSSARPDLVARPDLSDRPDL